MTGHHLSFSLRFKIIWYQSFLIFLRVICCSAEGKQLPQILTGCPQVCTAAVKWTHGRTSPSSQPCFFCLQNGMTVWGFLTGNKFDYVATLLLWISSWNVYGEGSGAQICKRLPLRRQEEMGCLSRSSHHYLKWHLNWILEIAFSVYVSKSFFFFSSLALFE